MYYRVIIGTIGLFSGAALAAQVTLSTGYFYADGQSNDLNTPKSTIQSISLGIKIKNDRWGVRLASSYLDIKNQNISAQSGMGDTTLSISYDLVENPWWTFTVKEKFATGDKNKGLSTGYNDTKLQLDFFRPVDRNKSLFATAGYTFKGGQSDDLGYQNAVYGSLGFGVVLAQGWSGGASIDFSQATSKNLDNTLGGSLFVGRKVSSRFSVSLFGGYDNTETLSAGLGLSYKLQ